MNEIQIFDNPEFGGIRVRQEGDAVLFVATDIARALNYANPAKAIIDHCKGVSVLETPTKNQYGATVIQNIKYIGESEVYRLVMKARTEKAEKFQDWVCGEVLPSIRKHGAYMSDEIIQRTLSDPDYLIKLATTMKQEREARLMAEQEAKLAKLALEEAAPAIAYQKVVEQSVNSILIRDLAKMMTKNGVSIGQNRLFGWLRENKYINDYNEPYQRYMDMGLFERIPYQIDHHGEMRTHFTTKVTGKGQVYFVNKYLTSIDK